MRWQWVARFNGLWLMVSWASSILVLTLGCWGLATAVATPHEQHASTGAAAATTSSQVPLDWLLTDRGPFHRAPEYADFMERHRQGFTTRYRIYR